MKIKIFLGFFLFLLIFFYKPSEPLAGCSQVPSYVTSCSGSQVACSQAMPPAGNIRRWCCDNQVSCDHAKTAVQRQISSHMGQPATIKDLETIFGNVVKSALGFAGIILFVLLLVGGMKYITSGGDPKAAEGAQKTITYAIGGLIVILLSFLVLVLIKQITGVDVTQFKITQ